MKNVFDTDESLIQYDEGKMLALISINEKPAGVILFGDYIRPGITFMIQRLRNLGVRQTVMLTGDSYENGQKIAQQIGITYFESDLLPEQKVVSVNREHTKI
jgi:Zn2+/Cd2+-exporting ATPase